MRLLKHIGFWKAPQKRVLGIRIDKHFEVVGLTGGRKISIKSQQLVYP